LLFEQRQVAKIAHRSQSGTSMPKTPIFPRDSPPPLAPYSPGVKAGNVVYVSGVLPLDREGKLVGQGDVTAQTRQVLENIKSVLEAAGGTMDDIVFNAIFLSNMSHYAEMNSVYKTYFERNAPARYCVRADLVKPEFLVEIASTAHLSEPR
jgi:aminoacrylate peracid reductase